ncbi:hypothetical protein CRG98_005750 [Punica granatum]|uniref:Uncharacterized protein n=1 Tax=Punica granatum TaxID=22663 RepID=A0A2I0KZW7_PUNGR|nr:hypothetical protein CRG98_005750 [Punica granatum]
MWSIFAYTLSRALKHPPSTIDLESGSSSVLGTIYYLSSKKLTGALQVPDLKNDDSVTHAFGRCCSKDGSPIITIFMRGHVQTGDTEAMPGNLKDIPYAMVKPERPEGKNFVATVKSEGALKVGDFDNYAVM